MITNTVHIKINPAKRLILHSAAAAKQQQLNNILINKKQKEYETKLLMKLKEKSK